MFQRSLDCNSALYGNGKRTGIPGWRSLLTVSLILLIHVLLCSFFSLNNYLTVDEPVHIVGGLEILQNGNHTINPESGVLPQVVAGLPLLGKVSMPKAMTMERRITTPYPYARYILFEKHSLRDIAEYLPSRLCMTIFSLICGLCLWFITKQCCGRYPANVMLCCYAVLPLFVSNAPLATADTASTAFFIAVLFFGCRTLRFCNIGNWLLFTISCACLILSKFSGVSIAVILLILLVCTVFSRSKFEICLPFIKKRVLKTPVKRFCVAFLAFLLTVFVIYGTIWTVYGFQSDFPKVPHKALAVRDYRNFADNCAEGFIPNVMKFCGNQKILPRPFVYGFLHTYHYSRKRWSYLNGKTSMYGFRQFFPLVFLYKTPICAILSILTGGIVSILMYLRGRKLERTRIKMLFPYILFGVFFFVTALFTNLNIGYRHLMPQIAAFLPLIAVGTRFFTRHYNRTVGWKHGISIAIPVVLLLGTITDSLYGFPHTLAYFSPVFGGRDTAVRHICDSSLDWGQDITFIRGEMEKRNIPVDGSLPIYLNYFGSVPESLSGIPDVFLHPYSNEAESPAKLLFDFKPGWYLISATHLHGYQRSPVFEHLLKSPGALAEFMNVYYYVLENGFDPRVRNYDHIVLEVRNFQALRHEILRQNLEKMPPDFNINYSVYAYYLDENKLRSIFRDLRRKY